MYRIRRLTLYAATIAVAGCGSPSKPDWAIGGSFEPKHPVTRAMQSVADRMPGNRAFEFDLSDPDGVQLSLKDLLKKGPVVTVAIKDGCPCNVESQPLFNELSARYRRSATFVGFFNESPEKAHQYIAQFEVPYPVLVDKSLTAIKAYKAERSVYVTLVGADGFIVKTWAGYSKPMFEELDKLLTNLTGLKIKPFDAGYAPLKLSSGCQLFAGEAVPPNADEQN